MRKKYEDMVLNALLDKYEKSGKAKGRDTGRRIILTEKDLPLLFRYSTPEEKHAAISSLEGLSDEGILSFSYLPGEEGNIIEKAILNEKNAEKAFLKAGREPSSILLASILEETERSISAMPESEIRLFLEKEAIRMKEKRAPDFRFFSRDMAENRDMLKALEALASLDKSVTKRVFSAEVFNDSKRFERSAEAPVLKVLRALHRDAGKDDLLSLYGVSGYPEIIEFCGKLRITFKDGSVFDASGLMHGAYINSESISEIASVSSEAQKVISIENKANYIDCIRKNRSDGDIVIWHGGFYSPAKGKFLKALATLNAQWLHWSDIDIGGFRIFIRLKENIREDAIPIMMDDTTLLLNKAWAQSISTEYREELKALLEDKSFSIFHKTIEAMIPSSIRLEQEELI